LCNYDEDDFQSNTSHTRITHLVVIDFDNKIITSKMCHLAIMITINADRIAKYSSANAARHEAKIQEIMEITDQEVQESLGTEEPKEIQRDVLYEHFKSNQSSFYSLTGFQITEFEKLWIHVEKAFTAPARGRKPKISAKDIIILLLHYLRRYPRVEQIAAIFSLKSSTVQAIITKYIPILAEIMKRNFIDAVAKEEIVYNQDFPECAYIIDATVQEIYKPFISFEKAKKYFSGKHRIYCLKSQVIVTIKGLVVSIITSIPGSKHDKNIFDSYKKELDALFSLHPNNSHKIIADKGYQEADSQILVTPFKGNALDLTREKLSFNQKLGGIRIIIENFFGRLKSRYEIMSSTFRGSHETYAPIFTICCALVNFEQIECDHPLRERDMRFYVRLQASIKQKVLESETKSRAKRRRQARLRRRIFGEIGEDQSSSSSEEEFGYKLE